MDLIVIVALALVALPLVALTSGVLRIVIGLALVLFFPGYTLLAALIPRKSNLNGIERLALSFGLSIALVPLIGLALNFTPGGIRLYSMVLSLLLFVLVTASVAWFRRRRLSPEERFEPRPHLRTPSLSDWWSHQSRWDKAITIVPVLTIVGAIGVLAYSVATPSVTKEFTEFYILGPEGKAENYPRELATGEEAKVILGIVNREHETMGYRVEITSEDEKTSEIGPITLENDEKWERDVSFVFKVPGEKELEFLLFRQGRSEVYYRIYLPINVTE